MLTQEHCKKILFNLGIQLGVSPRLISTRLLSDDDKQDMINSLISQDELETAVKVWMNNNMPDYANGKLEPYMALYDDKVRRYRGYEERPLKSKFRA